MPENEEAADKTRFCSRCGTEISQNSQYCSSCGTSLSEGGLQRDSDSLVSGLESRVEEFERRGYPVRRGAIVGGASFLLTYVLMGVAALLSSDSSLSEFTEGGISIPIWKIAAWVFYSAHGAEVQVSVGGSSAGVGFVPSPFAYVLPPVVLIAGGYLLAKQPGRADFEEIVKRSATIAVGYSLLAIVGVFVSAYSVTVLVDFSIEPDPVTGIALAGVLYPVVFGLVGGTVFHKLAQIQDTDRKENLEKTGRTVLVVLVLVALFGSVLTSGFLLTKGDPATLEIRDWEGGQLSSYSDQLESKVVIENTGEETVVTGLKTTVAIHGGGEYSASKKITLEPGETRTFNLQIASLDTLTSSEEDKLNRGEWTFTVEIGGETRVDQ